MAARGGRRRRELRTRATAACSKRPASASRTSRAARCRLRPPQHRPELAGAPFEAMGVSLVFHPRNPYVPDRAHERALVRAPCPKAAQPVAGSAAAWTSRPTTASRKTRAHFHRTCRDALAPFGADMLPALQELVRRVLLPEAPQRAARHRRRVLRRLRRSAASSAASR